MVCIRVICRNLDFSLRCFKSFFNIVSSLLVCFSVLLCLPVSGQCFVVWSTDQLLSSWLMFTTKNKQHTTPTYNLHLCPLPVLIVNLLLNSLNLLEIFSFRTISIFWASLVMHYVLGFEDGPVVSCWRWQRSETCWRFPWLCCHSHRLIKLILLLNPRIWNAC